MASQTFLDLDEVPTATPEKVLKLKGVSHPMKVLTVGEFIDQAKLTREIKKDAAGTFEFLVEAVATSFPSLGVEGARKLTMPQLNAILGFVRDGDDDGAAEGNAEAEKAA
ncbi:hypothetical protein [Inquilinus sp. OTU3971]|uniref:hypothetical protein n=1 Tax=Inquilinus sp. OTU3971 TaxID=3043855 RepID=UPI00313E20B6